MSLALADLLDNARYEQVRARYRERMMTHKATRRVAVGDRVSLCFEDRETVRYQIQEMARAERIREPSRLAHELAVYGELLPSECELSATLFIEIPEPDQIREQLDRLLGIDECVRLEIGSRTGEDIARAHFDSRQLDADRISAVHYLRFPLSARQREALLGGQPAWVTIDHAAYRETAELSAATLESLRRDLAGTTPELLALDAITSADAPDRLLEQTPNVRVLEAARKLRTHHFIVEPSRQGTTLSACEPAVVSELFLTARRLTQELADRGIASQIVTHQDADGNALARVLVLSVDNER